MEGSSFLYLKRGELFVLSLDNQFSVLTSFNQKQISFSFYYLNVNIFKDIKWPYKELKITLKTEAPLSTSSESGLASRSAHIKNKKIPPALWSILLKSVFGRSESQPSGQGV
jgi:hypothetical protein